jgi:hypothetical protein
MNSVQGATLGGSDWDILAMNEKGEKSSGVFVSPLGIEVTIYKNWLYVEDHKAWEEGIDWISPVVMEVQCGSFSYKDVKFVAFRGPQNGIFCIVWSVSYPDKPEGIVHAPSVVTGMVGCGVYGYDHEKQSWVGVTKETTDWFNQVLVASEIPDLFRSLVWPVEETKKLELEPWVQSGDGGWARWEVGSSLDQGGGECPVMTVSPPGVGPANLICPGKWLGMYNRTVFVYADSAEECKSKCDLLED